MQTLERTPIEITTAHLMLSDPDNDVSELSVRVLDGADYQRAGNTVTPEAGVVGQLGVNLVVSDGELDSGVFALNVQVGADTVPPVIVLSGSATVSVDVGIRTRMREPRPRTISMATSATGSLSTTRSTPAAGTYTITYSVEDLAGNAAVAIRTVIVEASANDPPVIQGQLPLQTPEDESDRDQHRRPDC